MNLTDFFSSITEYSALLILGCVLTGNPVRRCLKNIPLIPCFALIQLSIQYFFTSFAYMLPYITIRLLSDITAFIFFFALFYHTKDSSMEYPAPLQSEHRLPSMVQIFYLFAIASSLLLLTHIAGNIFIPDSFVFFRWQEGMENLLVCGLVLILFYICPGLYERIRMNQNPILKSILIHVFFLLYFFQGLFETLSYSIEETFFFLLFFCLILVCMNLILFYYVYVQEKQQEKLNSFEKYMPMIDGLIRDIRMKQHSYHNTLQSILSLPATYRDYPSLVQALQKYGSYRTVNEKHSEILKLNLKLVAGFLIGKCASGEDEGKQLQISLGTTDLHSTLPESLLVEIMGILIDNALEAISPGETVHLKLDTHGNRLYLKIKNPGQIITPKERDYFFRYGCSTKDRKKGNRGLGLSRLNQVVHSCGGMLILSNETEHNQTYIVFELEV